MKTREILIIAAVAAAAYFLYKRMQKPKQTESSSPESTPERPSTATPPIVPTFESVNPEDFERQAFEIVRN
jgi:hypothetical protein